MKKPINNFPEERKQKPETWDLSLYVLDDDPRSIRALKNVKSICEEYLPGRCNLEVIDLAINPEVAKRDQIVALPTLVRKRPKPGKRLVGDLSNMDRVVMGLDLRLVRRLPRRTIERPIETGRCVE
jgi:circadian clock protein KaiB